MKIRGDKGRRRIYLSRFNHERLGSLDLVVSKSSSRSSFFHFRVNPRVGPIRGAIASGMEYCYRYTIYEEDSRILTWIEGIFEDVKIVRVLFQKIDIRGEGRDCKLSFILSLFKIKFRIVKVGSIWNQSC